MDHKLELLEKSYNILAGRDPQFKKEWEELNKYSIEDFSNSEELKKRIFNFTQKYDKILIEIIKGL